MLRYVSASNRTKFVLINTHTYIYIYIYQCVIFIFEYVISVN